MLTETKQQGGTTDRYYYIYDFDGNLRRRQWERFSSVSTAEKGSVTFQKEEPDKDVVILEIREYNGFNQLMKLTRDAQTTKYQFRPDGLRHSKSSQGGTVHIWDGQNLVAEYSGNGSMKARYLRGTNLIAQQIDANLYFYCYNTHGDVVQRTDQAGGILNTYEYDAFGNERDPDLVNANPFRYCGEYYDCESGSLYLRARYYDMRTGRFTSEDTVTGKEKDPLSLNRYAYGHSNPLRYSDPSGHFALSMLLGTALIGGAIGWGVNLYGQLSSNSWNLSAVNQRSLWAATGAGFIAGGLSPFAAGVTILGSHILDIVASGSLLDGFEYGAYHILNGSRATLGGYAGAMTSGSVSAGAMYVPASTAIINIPKDANYNIVNPDKSVALQTYYPPNTGFLGVTKETSLSVGSVVQRTGDLYGSYIAPGNAPRAMLSLPPSPVGQPTTYLQVTKPMPPVIEGIAAPWFGQPGLGTQYYLQYNKLDYLIINEFLKML